MSLELIIYQNLLNKLQKIIGSSKQKLAKEILQQKVTMAWNLGKEIDEFLQKNNSDQERLEYGKKIFDKLEEDIAIPKNNLYQMRKFYQTYPTLPKENEFLSWSHYRDLIAIEDENKRQYFEEITLNNNLSSKELRKQISLSSPKTIKNGGKLKVTRGEIFTYKIKKLAGSGNEKFLDLGFKIFLSTNKLPNNKWPDFDEKIFSVKKGENFKFNLSETQNSKIHTYKAHLEKIVDGDTLNVVLDLGFGTKHQEIIRLAKINAPEKNTSNGKKATAKLTEILANIPYLIIKTNKTDIYGRYVGDVFLAKNDNDDEQEVATNGQYLNQILVDEGVAEMI